jgi:hypothetical protein
MDSQVNKVDQEPRDPRVKLELRACQAPLVPSASQVTMVYQAQLEPQDYRVKWVRRGLEDLRVLVVLMEAPALQEIRDHLDKLAHPVSKETQERLVLRELRDQKANQDPQGLSVNLVLLDPPERTET